MAPVAHRVVDATQTALFGPDAPFVGTPPASTGRRRAAPRPPDQLADLPAGLNVPLPGMPAAGRPGPRRPGMPPGIRLSPRCCASCGRTLTDRRSILRGRGSYCHAAYLRDVRRTGEDPDAEREVWPLVCDAATNPAYI